MCVFMSATYSDSEAKFLKNFLKIEVPEPYLTMYELSFPANSSNNHYDIKWNAAGT